MGETIKNLSDLTSTIVQIESFLDSMHFNDTERVPQGVSRDLRKALSFLELHFGVRGQPLKSRLFSRLGEKVSTELTAGEAKGILVSISNLLHPPDGETRYAEGRLERKIIELERELARVRSNPVLEKKVAKLEEDLRKLRLASVKALENNEKEQEDMLKKYKSADRKVFVVMPFARIFDDVWRGGIQRACNTEGFNCLRVDKISLSSWITKDIRKCIEMADVVIADITGSNPNVMFELGWALALGKKPIVIRQQEDPDKVPFDVKDIRYISYSNSWSGIEKLYKKICVFIRSTKETLSEESKEKKNKSVKKKTKKSS